MEKIVSFKINHLTLMPGLYISRRDEKNGAVASTFDLRFSAPNREPVMDVQAVHTIEHLGATYLRNSKIRDKIIYFGPMGCRTGFYLIVFGHSTPEEIYPQIIDMLKFIIAFEGDIPGATAAECGNYTDQNLEKAKIYAEKYLTALQENRFFVYPK